MSLSNSESRAYNRRQMDVASAAPIHEVFPPPAIPFIREVANLYHRNAWVFLKILLPAACFGWFIVILCFPQADEITRYVPRGLDAWYHLKEIWEAAAIRIFGLIVEWILYCFAFSGMCIAVAKFQSDEPVLTEECFEAVRRRIGAFTRAAMALGALVALSFMFAFIVIGLLAVTLSHRYAPLTGKEWSILSLCVWGFFLWGVARFGLAIPVLFLENVNVRRALLRSYRLTNGCSMILGLLLLESVAGSYVAYMLPQWIWRAAYMHGLASIWMSWAATSVGVFAGVLLQPHMLVGFVLLFLRRKQDAAYAR
jgi:hypothetical protein